jgi:hypothetical protein
MEKAAGYKLLINNSAKHFNVNLKSKYIEFNQEWKSKLTENEILFCVRWAKVARRIGILNLTEIDRLTINWYKNKFGIISFNKFLSKITEPQLYNRLCFGLSYGNLTILKPSLWRRILNFLTRKK